MYILEMGQAGTDGLSGTSPGQAGTAGGAGGAIAASITGDGPDAGNEAKVFGGAGGNGGYGGSGPGPGGAAGAGGAGGSATASVSTTGYSPQSAGTVLSFAIATGGNGGKAGYPGNAGTGTTGPGNDGGAGGTAMASASNLAPAGLYTAQAYASASGGSGGAGYGVGSVGGAGGVASVTSVSSTGYSAVSYASQMGGSGGAGRGGATGGAGAASTLTNAVWGTSFGVGLTLRQTATGGAGGRAYGSGAGGASGAASSSLTFNDVTANTTHASNFSGSSVATGGAGGGGVIAAQGADANASINLTGANTVIGGSTATGGQGGDGYGTVAGAGGAATATASATSTTTGNYSVDSTAEAIGGTGGRFHNGMSGTGGAGGAATGASATSAEGSAVGGFSYAEAREVGGTGGTAYSTGCTGGAGGGASNTTATAIGYNAYAKAVQMGGVGGYGGRGAAGGAGAASSLTNAVTGTSTGGYLTLFQVANGGTGGYSSYGAAGAGGAAYSSLTFDDVTANATHASKLIGESTANGGNGGWDLGDTGTDGPSGAGSASINLTGAETVEATATAVGGYTFGSPANGNATATATQTAPTGMASATAYATGGSGYGSGTGTGAGGNATATATANETGQVGTAYASADASGNTGGTQGNAMAAATAIAAYGNLATATATATGNIASSRTTATSNEAGIVSQVSAATQALQDANNTIVSEADIGGDTFAFYTGSGDNDFADAAGLPSSGTTSGVRADNSNIAAALGGPNAMFLGAGYQGAYNDYGTTEQTYSSTASFTINGNALSGDLIAGFAGDETFTNSFTSLTLTITVGGTQVVDESFTDEAAANAFFSNNAIDLGAVAHVSDLTVVFSLTVITGAMQSGFAENFVLGATGNNPPTIAALSTAAVGVAKASAITGVSLAEPGSTAGETLTVTLSDTHGLLYATGTGVTGSGSKALTITGSLAQINANLATLTDKDTSTAADTITLTATDSLGNQAAAQAILVTVNGLPLVVAAPAKAVIGLGQNDAVHGVSLSETGNTAGEIFTVTLSDTNGLLYAAGAGVSGTGTKALTITGSLAQVNADLATLTDTDATTPSDTITLNANDSFGNVAKALKLAVTVNGLPALAAPGTLLAGVNKATKIAGLKLSETGNTTGETFTVHIADTYGILAAKGSTVTGAGTTALTITGTLAQVDAALASLTDTDAIASPDMINLAAIDSLGNASSASAIAVTVNGLPIIVAPATTALTAGASTAITGVSLSETGNTATGTFTVTLKDKYGLLTAAGGAVTGGGSKSLTIKGTLAQLNAALATLTDTDSTTKPDTISLKATDTFGNATAATMAITVTGTAAISASSTVVGATLFPNSTTGKMPFISENFSDYAENHARTNVADSSFYRNMLRSPEMILTQDILCNAGASDNVSQQNSTAGHARWHFLTPETAGLIPGISHGVQQTNLPGLST